MMFSHFMEGPIYVRIISHNFSNGNEYPDLECVYFVCKVVLVQTTRIWRTYRRATFSKINDGGYYRGTNEQRS